MPERKGALVVPENKTVVCPACRGALVGEGKKDASSLGCRCTRCRAFYPWREGILHLTRGVPGAKGYDPHYFSTLPQVEHVHFWFVHRREPGLR